MNKENKKDLFAGCSSPGFLIIFIVLIIAIFSPDPYQSYLYVLFFFIMGILCLMNYNGCGRTHCIITGFGGIGIGVIALLKVLTVINISWNSIWLIFLIILVIGYGYEFLRKGKTGSCYKK